MRKNGFSSRLRQRVEAHVRERIRANDEDGQADDDDDDEEEDITMKWTMVLTRMDEMIK